MTLTPALDIESAHEVGALFLAGTQGSHTTWHGDDFQCLETHVLRDSHGWPYAVELVLADHSRGPSIRLHCSVMATPIEVRG